MTGIIYQIINNINGDFYIGKTTKSIDYRFYQHQRNAHHNYQTYLYRAMRKYGIENFHITIVERTSELNIREKYWIGKLCPAYNMTKGGDGGDTSASPNYQISLKSRRDMSGANNPMFGRKRNIPKKQLDNAHHAASLANKCPVLCEGKYYSSVGCAEKAYPGVKLRKRLDSPEFPDFIRLRPKTIRPRVNKKEK